MRLQELDEWQGLTADMVRAYLERTGWTKHGTNPSGGFAWTAKDGKAFFSLRDWELEKAITVISQKEQRKLQALLRDINPRMCKGKPSLDELRAWPFWLVRDTETGEVEMMAAIEPTKYLESVWCSRDFPQWEYWPCDADGNKTRWPEVAAAKADKS
jgi:hypothetical protein